MPVPVEIERLVERFHDDRGRFRRPDFNETQTRVELINPFFIALGWDVNNSRGAAVREVVHEDKIEIEGKPKAPDYSFRLDNRRKFFVEAKKPAVDIAAGLSAAFQVRRYAWTAKLARSVLTDFEEFAVYDATVRPKQGDPPTVARVTYFTYDQYPDKWDDIAALFSREAVLSGSLDALAPVKRAEPVDAAFLATLDEWRVTLARAFANRNKGLSERELNYAVQQTIDRILFLRIAEDRGVEPYGRLGDIAKGADTYARLMALFRQADGRYNSGLFHFAEEKHRDTPDTLTPRLTLDDAPLKGILKALYEPVSPYEFSVFPPEVLGQVYEQFLGKVIRLTDGHRAVVEEKPEVKKAGGVYYTPSYIVDYIVRQTVGKLVEGHTPSPDGPVSRMRVLDPACGSGSFLLGAYQFLLDWHLQGYRKNAEKWLKGRKATLAATANGETHLTLAERKRILLDNLYGVDIDAQAVEVTKLSLLLKLLEGTPDALSAQLGLLPERVLPDLSGNIHCGNSLIGPDFYAQQSLFAAPDATAPVETARRAVSTTTPTDADVARVNAFDWKATFPDIFAAGGFDAVIGNPPYIRIQTLKEWAPLEVEHYKKAYRAASSGNYDIYVVFVERGLQLLSERGRLGYILPQKFYKVQFGEALRTILANSKNVAELVSFTHNLVFPNAFVNTCLLLLTAQQNEAFDFKEISKNTTGVLLSELLDAALPMRIGIQNITATPWVLRSTRNLQLLQKLREHGTPLAEQTDRIFQGLKTSADKLYVLDLMARGEGIVTAYSKHADRVVELEEELCRVLIKGTEMRRYAPLPSKRVVLFPYQPKEGVVRLIPERELRERFPRAYSYFREHQKFLREREHGKMNHVEWYAYGRGQALDVVGQPKLITPDLAPRASFLVDGQGGYFFLGGAAGGYGIVPTPEVNPLYLAGLLNSLVASFYITQSGQQMESGYYSFEARFIRDTPIRTIDFTNPADAARHDRMVALVEGMLDLHKRLAAANTPHEKTALQRQIDATDRQIDALVYELYGLTDEEIAIVEGSATQAPKP